MNELIASSQCSLPAQPADLAKFILVAPEKVKAMQAEIRAIQKAQLAKEVYDQKKAELDRLRELMLLAYQRMGEITKEMPTSPGKRTDREPSPASGTRFEKPKKQIFHELGFSKNQVSRMEKMATHPEIVEEVIAESQAGRTEATQGEVLRRIKEQERGKVIDLAEIQEEHFQRDMALINSDYENLKCFRKAITLAGMYEITEDMIESVVRSDADLDATIVRIGDTIQFLTAIKCKLTERRARFGKTNFYAGSQGLHFR